VAENKFKKFKINILIRLPINKVVSGRNLVYNNVKQYLNRILWTILLDLGKLRLWFRNNKDLKMLRNYFKVSRNLIHILCRLKYLSFKEIDFFLSLLMMLKVLLIYIMKLSELIHLILMCILSKENHLKELGILMKLVIAINEH